LPQDVCLQTSSITQQQHTAASHSSITQQHHTAVACTAPARGAAGPAADSYYTRTIQRHYGAIAMPSNQPGRFHIRKVAVCGAGVMGAQIAAHCVNAGVPVLLYDLPSKDGDPRGMARKAIAQLAKASPAPLGAPELAALIVPAGYDTDMAQLAECDLVIEAIAERLDWKHDLYQKLAPAIRPDAILASNTSGLSIEALAGALPQALRSRFCGVHFFNPPRYMPLVELIATAGTGPGLLD